MDSIFIFPGLVFEAVIRWIATLLAAEGTAGNICIMLLVGLIIVSTRFISIQNNASSLVSKALKIIYRSEGEKDFSANLELRRDLQNFDNENKGEFAHNFATAWREYNETFYEDDTDTIKNTVRPMEFFNSEEISQLNPLWKQVPSIFVSIGLLLTFLGIISAIGGLVETGTKQVTLEYEDNKKLVYFTNINGQDIYAFQKQENGDFFQAIPIEDPNSSIPTEFRPTENKNANEIDWQKYTADGQNFSEQGMSAFLNSTKSKFLMSLTGLFCSIVFLILFRTYSRILERKLREFCDALEERVEFLTVEKVVSQQLTEAQQTNKLLEKFNSDLSATIGNALNEQLPAKLSEKLDPVINRVMNTSTDTVGTMVEGLGNSLHEKLNESLKEIASTLSGVNTALMSVSEKLNSSGENIASEINKVIQDLSAGIATIRKDLGEEAETSAERRKKESEESQEALSNLLSKIEENTREGAIKMAEAATAISDAASNLKETIQQAGEASSKQIADMLDGVNKDARQELESAGSQMANGIKDASATILSEAEEFQKGIEGVITGPVQDLEKSLDSFSTNLKNSSNSLENHGRQIREASSETKDASEALQNSTNNLRQASDPIRVAVQNISDINKRIIEALSASSTSIQQTGEVVQNTLKSLGNSIEKFDVIIEKSSDIDEKLGAAFIEIKTGLEEAQEKMSLAVEQSTNSMTQGVTALRAAVDDVKEYKS